MPKYATIAADLEQRIREGEFLPGDALPAQRELSASYGVTLMTLRQALSLLTERGLVAQMPGRGTYVSSQKAAYHPGSLRSLSGDLQAQGRIVDTVLLAREQAPLPSGVAERLAVAEGAPGVRVERLRRLGRTPAIHQVSWLPAGVAGSVLTADLAAVSLYQALADGGTIIESASERLSPDLLEEHLSALLGPAGTAVFRSERITFAANDVPVVFDRAVITGDLVEIRTERRLDSMSLQWESTT